jgi:spore germination protein GerM
VAVRKGTGKKVSVKNASVKGNQGKKSGVKSASWVLLFWLAFAIFIIGLFLFNREAIGKSIQLVQNEFASRKSPEEQVAESDLDAEPASPLSHALQPTARQEQQSAAESQAGIAGGISNGTNAAAAGDPAAGATGNSTPGASNAEGQPAQQNTQTPQEQRDRVLYFTQIDRSGYILRVRTDRRFPVSLSPLTDVIQALISGPNDEEKRKGLVSLVPSGTKILSVAIRGDTAYINLSEDFLYNTYGVEGYAGQLRQIVFTATEFPNIKDVQILIEGGRVDYLGEGVWIGSPLSREML